MKTACTNLYVAKRVLIYLSSKKIISSRETVGSIREQLICIGENYLNCSNKKKTKKVPSFFQKKNSLMISAVKKAV